MVSRVGRVVTLGLEVRACTLGTTGRACPRYCAHTSSLSLIIAHFPLFLACSLRRTSERRDEGRRERQKQRKVASLRGGPAEKEMRRKMNTLVTGK